MSPRLFFVSRLENKQQNFQVLLSIE